MLHYCDVGLSHAEVPGETSLCFYISGCINRCKNCHFPELQFANYGDELKEDIFVALVELYSPYETCICFMGEGNCTDDTKKELVDGEHIDHLVVDKIKEDENATSINFTTHELGEHFPEKESNCTYRGYQEHWKCKKCSKFL